jgi:hypothetical protein
MAENPSCPNNSALLSALKSLPRDPSGLGFSHLGMDGVWRNFDGAGNVLSYRALNPEEIKEALEFFPKSVREKIEKELDGVDGRDVTDMEQLLQPREDLVTKLEENEGKTEL